VQGLSILVVTLLISTPYASFDNYMYNEAAIFGNGICNPKVNESSVTESGLSAEAGRITLCAHNLCNSVPPAARSTPAKPTRPSLSSVGSTSERRRSRVDGAYSEVNPRHV
jgi:hypothetical protein